MRPITEIEFKRLRQKDNIYDVYRQMAKAVNFGFLFGMASITFAETTLSVKWTQEQVDDFIEEFQLYDKKFNIAKKYKDVEPKMWGYITVADYIRDQFFKTYKGLADRIERNKQIGEEQGYVRSYHGAIRRTPVLMLKGKDEDRKEVAGLYNILANTTIQNDEACKVMGCMVDFQIWKEANNIKSYIQGMVHDSVDFIIWDNEMKEVIAKIKEIFERMEPWQKGVPLTVDIVIADPREGEYYKGGVDWRKYFKEHNLQ